MERKSASWFMMNEVLKELHGILKCYHENISGKSRPSDENLCHSFVVFNESYSLWITCWFTCTFKAVFSCELSNAIWKNDIREIPTVVYPVCFLGIPNSAAVTAAPGSSEDLEL